MFIVSISSSDSGNCLAVRNTQAYGSSLDGVMLSCASYGVMSLTVSSMANSESCASPVAK